MAEAIEKHRKVNDYDRTNWELYEQSWQAFMDYLGDRWWGVVPGNIHRHALNNLKVGSLIVTTTATPRFGEMCTILEVCHGRHVRCIAICAMEGQYTIGSYLHARSTHGYTDLIPVLESMLATGLWSLVPRPVEFEFENSSYPVNLGQDMRRLIKLAKHTWLGTRESSATCLQIIEELKRYADTKSNPAALVCFKRMDAAYLDDLYGQCSSEFNLPWSSSIGYMFSVITLQFHCLVTSHRAGYSLLCSNAPRSEIRRRKLTELWIYMNNNSQFTLIPLTVPSLQYLCRGVLNNDCNVKGYNAYNALSEHGKRMLFCM